MKANATCSTCGARVRAELSRRSPNGVANDGRQVRVYETEISPALGKYVLHVCRTTTKTVDSGGVDHEVPMIVVRPSVVWDEYELLKALDELHAEVEEISAELPPRKKQTVLKMYDAFLERLDGRLEDRLLIFQIRDYKSIIRQRVAEGAV